MDVWSPEPSAYSVSLQQELSDDTSFVQTGPLMSKLWRYENPRDHFLHDDSDKGVYTGHRNGPLMFKVAFSLFSNINQFEVLLIEC